MRFGVQYSRVGGRAMPAPGARRELTVDPALCEPLAQVEYAGAEVVDAAVDAARLAQPAWAALSGTARGRVLAKAAQILRARNDEIAEIETRDTGKPIQETRAVDVASAADCLEYFAGQAASIAGEHIELPGAFAYTRREPIGVVAGIGAWNYPIQIAAWKAAPALAAGNAMVFKAAEQTPLTAGILAEVFSQAGLPAGVFNVVLGDRATGQLLTSHAAVRKVSLTGAVSTGKAVMAAAAPTLKQVTLELGGKSPLIVFDDARIDEAVSGALLGNFYSAGEVCSNGTRVFVHRSIKARFLERLKERTDRMRIGPPLDPATQVGSLIGESHAEKVMAAIDCAKAEGARLICGGTRVRPAQCPDGAFVAPTIFDGCSDGMSVVRDEIFGPVMTILDFADEAEVLARANATDYGLAAGVFTQDLTRAHRVAAALQAGVCWINAYNVTPVEVPFGGIKLSGIGRENGRAALDHYTQIKTVYVGMTDIDAPY